MEFSIEIALPSGKTVRVRELKNSEYLSIIKFAQNKDFRGLGAFLDEFFIRPDLNIVDRIYLLIYMRMTFIEPDINLSIDNRSITVSVASMLDKIEESYVDLETKVDINGIEVTLDLPCITYYDTIDELLLATIKHVQIGNDSIDYNELDVEVRDEVLNNLPAAVFSHVNSFLQTIQDNLLNVDLIEENKSIGIDAVRINLMANNILEFISNIYGTDLQGFYTLIYSFQNTIMPGSSCFFDMSPVETRIIMKAHQKRLKEENDQLKKQRQ
jgi:hypothetical protein